MQTTRIKVSSIIDKNNLISKDNWVLAIGRKIEGMTKNAEHAFLLIEGIDKNNEVFVSKYEFGVDKTNDSSVNIVEKHGAPSDIRELFHDLLWHSTPPHVIADLKYSSDGWCKKSWSITKEQGEKLIGKIEESKNNPPLYTAIGINSISGSSNVGSLKRGHNCYTWATAMLTSLEDKRIIEDLDQSKSWVDKLITVTSRHIKNDEPKSWLSMFGFGGGSTIGSKSW